MKEAFIFLLLAAVAYLAYDDYAKRDALNQTQQQLQQLNLYYTRQSTPQTIPPVQSTRPDWFQQHLNKGSALDASQRHDRP